MKSRTFAIIKPDIVDRDLVYDILARIEGAGFNILNMSFAKILPEDAILLYQEHRHKDFFMDLVKYMTSGYSVQMVLSKEDAVAEFRKLIGPAGMGNAKPGTIRGDYSQSTTRNCVHGSDSQEAADREINIFFPKPKDIEPLMAGFLKG